MLRSSVLFLLLFYTTAVVFAAESRKRGDGKRPYEASCPQGCRCTSNTLDCRNAKLTTVDLYTVRPEAFVELDTIDFYNAELGAIHDGLFPQGVIHPFVTSVNLTKCGITRIGPRSFEAFPKVEFLGLSENAIEYAGKETFSQLKVLKILDMKNALARRASQADLLAGMFDSRGNGAQNLINLVSISLDDNDLANIHPSTFCKVRGLTRLQLAGNQLSSFDVQESCLPSLKSLDISRNNFTTIAPSLWDHLGSVTTLDISRNPLQCDCKLQPMVEIAKDEKNDFLNQELTTCVGPEPMKGKSIFDLKVDLCKQGGYGFGTFFLLLLIAGGVLFAYRYYNRRRRSKVPFEFAYSGLDADDEVQPEFV